MTQSELFTVSGDPAPCFHGPDVTPADAKRLGYAGAECAHEAATPDWKHLAEQALRDCCRRYESFTTDQVRARYAELTADLDIETPDPRAWGHVLIQGAKNGWCAKSGVWRDSNERVCHGRSKAVWLSNIPK